MGQRSKANKRLGDFGEKLFSDQTKTIQSPGLGLVDEKIALIYTKGARVSLREGVNKDEEEPDLFCHPELGSGSR